MPVNVASVHTSLQQTHIHRVIGTALVWGARLVRDGAPATLAFRVAAVRCEHHQAAGRARSFNAGLALPALIASRISAITLAGSSRIILGVKCSTRIPRAVIAAWRRRVR